MLPILPRWKFVGGISPTASASRGEGGRFGCGTGHVTRDLIEVAGAAEAIGIEPSPVLIARAREQHSDVPGLKFQEGDAAITGIAARSIDLVVMHTLLCHAPAVEALLSEAARIIKPGGLIAVFDGDYG